MKLNLAFVIILTGLLLYKIYWGDGVTTGSMSITIGLIVLNLIFFITKYRKSQHDKMKDQISDSSR